MGKQFKISERIGFKFDAQFYNLFNHPNFFLDNNLANGSFGTTTRQQLPRNWQIGGKITF